MVSWARGVEKIDWQELQGTLGTGGYIIVVVDTQLYTHVKINWWVYSQRVILVVCKLYLNKL